MKKTVTVLLATLLVFVLAACGGSKDTAAAGTYKIKSMVMGGQTFTADELAANGVDMSDFSMELKDSGEFTMRVIAGEESETVNGTWKADGSKISLTAEGQTMEAELDGKTLTVSQDGMELVFEK